MDYRIMDSSMLNLESYNWLHGNRQSLWDSLQFQYSNVSYQEFALRAREVPLEDKFSSAWKATTTALYHIPKGVTSLIAGDLDELQQHTYHCIRNIEEAFGWVTSLFFETFGLYLVADSLFHQQAYWIHEKEKSPCSIREKDFFIQTPISYSEQNASITQILSALNQRRQLIYNQSFQPWLEMLGKDGVMRLKNLTEEVWKAASSGIRQPFNEHDWLNTITLQDLIDYHFIRLEDPTLPRVPATLCRMEDFAKLTVNDLDSSNITVKLAMAWPKVDAENGPNFSNAKEIPLVSAKNLPVDTVIEIIKQTGRGYILSLQHLNEAETIMGRLDCETVEGILPSIPKRFLEHIPNTTINQLNLDNIKSNLADDLINAWHWKGNRGKFFAHYTPVNSEVFNKLFEKIDKNKREDLPTGLESLLNEKNQKLLSASR